MKNTAIQREVAKMVLVSNVSWASSVLRTVRRSSRLAISSGNTMSVPADNPNKLANALPVSVSLALSCVFEGCVSYSPHVLPLPQFH